MHSTHANGQNSVCEEQQFNAVFRTNSKDIFNLLVFKYGNKQLAEDAVQESFIKLWHNCKTVPLAKAKSFLYTVAKNKIIDSFRGAATAQRHANNHTNLVEKQTPCFLMEEREFGEELNAVLAKMPEKYRVPFLLNRIEKKKYKEVAILLDTTVKSIEKRIFNALEFLQNELQISKKRF